MANYLNDRDLLSLFDVDNLFEGIQDSESNMMESLDRISRASSVQRQRYLMESYQKENQLIQQRFDSIQRYLNLFGDQMDDFEVAGIERFMDRRRQELQRLDAAYQEMTNGVQHQLDDIEQRQERINEMWDHIDKIEEATTRMYTAFNIGNALSSAAEGVDENTATSSDIRELIGLTHEEFDSMQDSMMHISSQLAKASDYQIAPKEYKNAMKEILETGYRDMDNLESVASSVAYMKEAGLDDLIEPISYISWLLGDNGYIATSLSDSALALQQQYGTKSDEIISNLTKQAYIIEALGGDFTDNAKSLQAIQAWFDSNQLDSTSFLSAVTEAINGDLDKLQAMGSTKQDIQQAIASGNWQDILTNYANQLDSYVKTNDPQLLASLSEYTNEDVNNMLGIVKNIPDLQLDMNEILQTIADSTGATAEYTSEIKRQSPFEHIANMLQSSELAQGISNVMEDLELSASDLMVIAQMPRIVRELSQIRNLLGGNPLNSNFAAGMRGEFTPTTGPGSRMSNLAGNIGTWMGATHGTGFASMSGASIAGFGLSGLETLIGIGSGIHDISKNNLTGADAADAIFNDVTNTGLTTAIGTGIGTLVGGPLGAIVGAGIGTVVGPVVDEASEALENFMINNSSWHKAQVEEQENQELFKKNLKDQQNKINQELSMIEQEKQNKIQGLNGISDSDLLNQANEYGIDTTGKTNNQIKEELKKAYSGEADTKKTGVKNEQQANKIISDILSSDSFDAVSRYSSGVDADILSDQIGNSTYKVLSDLVDTGALSNDDQIDLLTSQLTDIYQSQIDSATTEEAKSYYESMLASLQKGLNTSKEVNDYYESIASSLNSKLAGSSLDERQAILDTFNAENGTNITTSVLEDGKLSEKWIANEVYKKIRSEGSTFATGLDTVDNDGLAFVHKGETILNKEAASDWRSGSDIWKDLDPNDKSMWKGLVDAFMQAQDRKDRLTDSYNIGADGNVYAGPVSSEHNFQDKSVPASVEVSNSTSKDSSYDLDPNRDKSWQERFGMSDSDWVNAWGSDSSWISEALDEILGHEVGGNFDKGLSTVVANDKGGLSLGITGMHESIAGNVLKNIYDSESDNVNAILDKYGVSELKNMIQNTGYDDSIWKGYIPDSNATKAIEEILGLDSSASAQGKAIARYMGVNLDQMDKYGVQGDAQRAYMLDYMNQNGAWDKEGVKAMQDFDGTLEDLYAKTVEYNGDYYGNREKSYNAFKELPQYDEGTNYLKEDQFAKVHKGEAIIPEKSNPFNSGELKDILQTLKWGFEYLATHVDKVSVSSSKEDIPQSYRPDPTPVEAFPI